MVSPNSWPLFHWLLSFIAILQIDAATTGQQNISSDAFFYGLSPPVYPTRKLLIHEPLTLFASALGCVKLLVPNSPVILGELESIANSWTAKGAGTGSWAAAYAKAAALVAQMTQDEKVVAFSSTFPLLTFA